MPDRLRLGTRASALARRQTELVVGGLRRAWPGLEVEVLPIVTEGDRRSSARLSEIGGKGVFAKEIEEALGRGEIDLAVHSAKDLPSTLPAGLTLGAVLEREDPRDVLVTQAGWGLAELPLGATVATGSPRRQAQLLHWRPDLEIVDIRGNVDTRLRKLDEGYAQALVLARAGLVRLGLEPPGARPLEPEAMLPAPGQGTLAVEVRADDFDAQRLVGPLDHPSTRIELEAERGFLARLGGSCRLPAACLAVVTADGGGRVEGLLADPAGTTVLRDTHSFGPGQAREAGWALAAALLEAGGAALMVELEAAR